MTTTDQRIRKAGYRIHARPNHGEAVQTARTGELWRQSELLGVLDAVEEERARLQAIEDGKGVRR